MKSAIRAHSVARRLSAPPSIAWLTGTVAVGTLVVSVTALADSTLMQEMTRSLPQMRAGQWWRLITPVFVQPDGWGQLVFNVLGIAIVGTALEQRTSRGAWILTYLLGGIGGVLSASVWQPADHSGGSSDAVAALIGALCVVLATEDHSAAARRALTNWLAPLYSVFFAGYLAALDLGGVWPSIVVGNATIIAFVVARHTLSAVALTRTCMVFVVVAGAVMAFRHDGHGMGIIAGTAIGSLIVLRRRVHVS